MLFVCYKLKEERERSNNKREKETFNFIIVRGLVLRALGLIRQGSFCPYAHKRGFCSHGAALRTPVLRCNARATPAKLPVCRCPASLLLSLLIQRERLT